MGISVTTDTIVAQATAPGRGGVGIIRISGDKATDVAMAVLGHLPKPDMPIIVILKMQQAK